jgi:O-antigen/teichoic acid export membrane protein
MLFAGTLNRLRNFGSSGFFADAATLAIGTTIAQVIPIAALPILARLFSPQDFGLFAVFAALVAVLATGASARYELAIILPDKEEDADALVIASAIISFLFSLILLFIALIASTPIANLLGKPQLGPFFLLVPLAVALTATYSALNFWLNRARNFKRMSANRIAQATLVNGSSLVLGFANVGVGSLLFGQLIGLFGTTVVLLYSFLRKKSFGMISCLILRSFQLLRTYKNHPQYLLPSHLIGTVAMYTPVLALSVLYGAAAVGYYFVAYRLVSLPTTIVAGAIGDVYRQRASVAYRNNGDFRGLFLTTLGTCVAIGIIPAILVAFTAPDVFALVLGEEWRISGEYAQFLVIAAYFQFIATPVDKGALIVGATRYIFVWHLLRLFAFTIVFGAGYYASLPISHVLMLFVGANIAVYGLDIFIEHQLSRKAPERICP